MESSYSVKRVIIPAMLVAVTVAISRMFIIPVPMTHGYINLCDAGIAIAAILYGKRDGLIVGGLSGFLLDLISGYANYMFFSLIVHGLEGFIFGWLGYNKSRKMQILAMVLGAAFMVFGYFVTDSILYKIPTGLAGVPMNIVQGIVGVVIGLPLGLRLKKTLKL
ncbi:ECF transporter S component [Paucilactobacillus suebicus]|uniref:Integral membrane protein n=1 Tax=Paucilactobacillus suebicus DSM 5007 = KCTC 3549 TaxID=1423807 RepID=A0A0R1W3I2_9LACO|nr:ECF transporter S component [Paucilactobacillus suebicus]KRM12392.1 hypothetical protein FD16_GL002387 [Paucilactobacillus suebicus DSM 5007 = KCTC 3549]